MSLTDPLRAYWTAVEARAKGATPGPWRPAESYRPETADEGRAAWAPYIVDPSGRHVAAAMIGGFDDPTEVAANVDLLAHARTDLPLVVQMLRRCVEAMEQARRESASEPKSAYARAATIILNTALADLAALCERGKG